jgi:hypothetical protein
MNSSLFPIGWRAVGGVALAAVLLTGAIQVQAARERIYPATGGAAAPGRDQWLYLQSGPALRRMTGALGTLAADLYWIRAIQHYGDTKRRLAGGPVVPEPPPMLRVTTSDEYTLLFPLLDITTTLDPRFKIAYRFGAVFLAEPYPRGPGRPDLAQALLEKGIRSQPDKWEYMEDIGFVHYWYDHDYRAAAGWFQRASEIPGAPWWLRSLSATVFAEGGDRRSSRVIWEGIRQSAEIDWLRQDAERRLDQLQALDWIDQLQQRVDAYTRATGAPPPDWQTLGRAGVLSGVPLDPRRVPFELVQGRVQVSERSTLWPMPEEPERRGPPAS